MRLLVAALAALLAPAALPARLARLARLAAQAVHPLPAPAVPAARRRSPVVIDGRLDEPAWAAATPATGFRQREPAEGRSATQPTEVRFLFDDDALYVGARLHDALGAAGVRTHLARRDEDEGDDYFALVLDTYHDHVGRLYLQVNPSGVQTDALGLGVSNPDRSWDGVWQVATRIDSAGWTAEIRIPFATLQYPRDGAPVWGLQLWRYVRRLNETSQWAFWTKHDAGGPAFFGHLLGVRPPRRLVEGELLPYTLARWSSGARRAPSCDAAACRRSAAGQVGADARARVAGAEISATVNPDFGQVELDPAVLNLTATESWFPEKRPFFLQQSGVFDFGALSCLACDAYVPVSLYYSRRIGRPPTLRPANGIDVPLSTPVLAAVRASSEGASGWSFGAIEAVTAAARARVRDASGALAVSPVEPPASYAAARVKRRLLDGRLTLGAALTSADRWMRSPAESALAAALPRAARAGGVDLDGWWGAHVYHATLAAALSTVAGDTAAITRQQRSSVRYLQRPGRRARGGAFGDAYDPARTTLDGYMATARVAREAGAWAWEAGTEVVSPGFEVNDLGFLTAAGLWWYGANVQRNFTRPRAGYQSLALTTGVEATRDFEGDVVAAQVHAVVSYVAPSFWSWIITAAALPAHMDDRLARGGPTLRAPSGGRLEARVVSDPRHASALDAYVGGSWDARGARDLTLAPTFTLRPGGRLTLALTPSAEVGTVPSQYVDAVADTTARAFGGARYVFARLAERTLALETRLGVTFTPRLSVDLYGQPFLAAGAYDAYGEYAAPRGMARVVYGAYRGTIAQDGPGAFAVDPDGAGPAAPFHLAAPDFTRRSLRGNAVLRWEYRPGSTLYLAWTQLRAAADADGRLVPGRDARMLLAAAPRSVVMLKASYDVSW